MRYLKYGIAYIALVIQIIYIIVFIMRLLGYIHLTFGDSEFIFWLIIVPSIYIYDKYKPFKLTGNLDLKIKRFFNSYFESQKSCPSCDRVVKASELTQDGKCIYCKEDKK